MPIYPHLQGNSDGTHQMPDKGKGRISSRRACRLNQWRIVTSILCLGFLASSYKWLRQISHAPQDRNLVATQTRVPLSLPFSLLESHLDEMLKYRSQNGTIVLVGFTEGYKDMLLNMVCRWKELNVQNYAIVAFDLPSFLFCWERSLPCLFVWPESDSFAKTSLSLPLGQTDSALYAWDSEGFKHITKRKSQQVLRILEHGYNVLWTDVDVFWKANPMPNLLGLLGTNDADVLIQSDATAEKEASIWVNSGFYYVRQSERTVRVFQEIVKDAAESRDQSEKPSFHRVLCQRRLDAGNCVNDDLSVLTHVLDRWKYAHGAMVDVLSNTLIDTKNDVVTMHFNYRAGFEEKKRCFHIGNMWLLEGDDKTCRAI